VPVLISIGYLWLSQSWERGGRAKENIFKHAVRVPCYETYLSPQYSSVNHNCQISGKEELL
jgi:hypothetical protein